MYMYLHALNHRCSQDFNCLACLQKVEDFLVVAVKQNTAYRSKTSKSLPAQAKMSLKMSLALPGGVHLVCWGVHCKLRLNIFSALVNGKW